MIAFIHRMALTQAETANLRVVLTLQRMACKPPKYKVIKCLGLDSRDKDVIIILVD